MEILINSFVLTCLIFVAGAITQHIINKLLEKK